MKKKSYRFSRWNILRDKIRATVFPLILRLAAPLVYLRRHLWPHKISLCRVEGIGKDGQPLAILCSATGQNKNFLLGLAFDGPAREQELGRFRLRDVFRANCDAKKNCSLAVVETNPSHHAWLNNGSWFFIPVWVRGEISLPVAEIFLSRDTVKSDLRKIQRHGFEYEITHDERRFDDFYHNMHLPYITKVHGDAAVFDSYAKERRLCENYDLLMVGKKSRRDHDIAGMLIIYEPSGPRLWSLGVRQDGPDYVHEGVIAALYHFSFAHLFAKGFSRVNMGSSRAFLNDGVLKFKRKLSQSITDCSWPGFALEILSDAPAAKSFLLNNPFIFQSDGVWRGAVFMDSALSAETIRQIDRDYFHPGLSKLVIYSFRPDEMTGADDLPLELAARVEIRSANELFSGQPHLP
jgi:hypothetical protein